MIKVNVSPNFTLFDEKDYKNCYAPLTLPVVLDGDGGADQRSPCSARVLMSATSEVVLCAAAAVGAVVWEAGSGIIWI